MEKHYQKIARALSLPGQGVHLVHYVVMNMKAACVFPPEPDGSIEPFFSPQNVCSAIMAYLRSKHASDPWGTLKQFGFESSMQVGRVMEAIQANKKTHVVAGLAVNVDDYAGYFSEEEVNLRPVRWIVEVDQKRPEFREAHHLLYRHFGGTALDSLVVSKRRFPEHVRADLQLALDQAFEEQNDLQLFGLSSKYTHEGISFRSLTESDKRYVTKVGPLTFSEVNVGHDQIVKCMSNGLWLSNVNDDTPFAVVLGAAATYQGEPGVQIEVAHLDTDDSREFADNFFQELQNRIEDSMCFRGKILSFEHSGDYEGRVSAVKVHELEQVAREAVILPQATLDLLDRNVVGFVQQRPELKKRGMDLKKGLLLFGPPGTGKTHTIHYLSRALPDTTTLIITSEQIGWLSRYITLARLLQPSLVVIEDADLIARQREQMGTCEEVMLNKLLNEMDGLRSDAEIIFILTTNRPETLEAALTARPGRIDQAIEFPLPNSDGRRRLAKLYAGTQQLDDNAVKAIVARTENTSAAFVKELMRRATQYAIVRGDDESINISDVEAAVDEMLFSGGVFNRRILGAIDTDNPN